MLGAGLKDVLRVCVQKQRGLQVVQMTNELAKSAGAAAVKIEYESGQFPDSRFVELLFEWTLQFECAIGEQIGELRSDLLELFQRDGLFQPHRQQPSHKPH